MSAIWRLVPRFTWILGLVVVVLVAGGRASAQQPVEPRGQGAKAAFSVDGQVALHSFMSLGDGHLQELADVLQLLAETDDVRSAQWQRIRGPLAGAAPRVVPAVLWFAEPSGAYSTLAKERAGDLKDRAYFSRVLKGERVVGDLVVSRSTSRNTAIVAVPVRGGGGAVVGVLGASVHLDSLGALIRREMGGLDGNLRFFAIDSTPIGALNSDPALIFTEPMKLGDEGMRNAFTEMLTRSEGAVTYTFQGRERTMLYRKSPVTGWWYAFGVVRD